MTVSTILFAQTAAPSGGAGALAPFLFQVGIIFAIFYFLMIRPQQKQRKAHEAAIMALKKGDHIVTAGGVVGEVLQRTGSYVPIFIIAGSAYLVALAIIHGLAPRLEPARPDSAQSLV